MTDCDCSIEVESRHQSRVLKTLLAINAVMFMVEVVTGLLAESSGLIADSLDMLADAVVYGIGLYAVGRAANAKIRAALASGYFQMTLALVVAFDVCRRAIFGSDPEPIYMASVGLIALAANVMCLTLIAKHRDGGVHMRASWVFSKNDVIANVGVILSGGLVYVTGVRWPDLVVGIAIAYIVFRGGIAIIADARNEQSPSEEALADIVFRPYRCEDYNACIDIFDANCPVYLAPNERKDYENFLESAPEGYEVCEVDGHVRGVFGLIGNRKNEKRLNWIMVDSKAHGMGIGARIMERVIQLGRNSEASVIGLSTSQKVAPFFKKYGATTTSITKDGHGPGIDRVDMVLPL